MEFSLNRNLDIYAKEHYNEMLCAAQKARTIAFIRRMRKSVDQPIRIETPKQLADPAPVSQDCPVSFSFWQI